MIKVITCCLSLWFLFGGSALAQAEEPVLLVKVDGATETISVQSLKVETLIHGFVAETRMTMVFYNPHNRVLEGDLQFPLPEGALVSGYALDVNGVLVDGVAVEKEKARVVFEKEVRKGVDPGLVEMTRGNNFRTRVYPVPPKGTRTVRVSVLSEVATREGKTLFFLPLRFPRSLKEFSLRLEVMKTDVAPRVVRGKMGALAFAPWREGFTAETKLADATLAEDLEIELPGQEARRVQTMKGSDGYTYFSINDFPTPPATGARTPLRRLGLYWDASGSRDGDHRRELALLEAFFRSRASSPVEVELVFFRDAPQAPKLFTVRNGDARELLDALRNCTYDGGTGIGALVPLPEANKPDAYFLFSDGLSNFGQEAPSEFNAPLLAFTDDARADHAFLRWLAVKTGGDYFNLKKLSDPEILGGLEKEAFQFIAATAEGTVSATYPSCSAPVHGRFNLVGRLEGDSARVTLSYGRGGKVQKRETFTVRRSDAPEGDLLMVWWAQKKVEELSVFARKNERAIVETGKKYGLATPGTSLLVLENLEQYLEHGIAPPRSLPDMRAEFERRVEERQAAAGREREAKIDHVRSLWRSRVEWWNTEFKAPPSGWGKSSKKRAAARETAAGSGTAAPPPPPTARPSPAPAQAAEEAMPEAVATDARADTDGMVQGESAADEKTKSVSADKSRPEPTIAVGFWDPDTPYLKALKTAPPAEAYTAYLQERKANKGTPAFFLDCAEFFFSRQENDLAVRILSNVAELDLENPALLRVMAHRLAQAERLAAAAACFEEVLRLRPEEPQSWRDLALVLGRTGVWARAMELLAHVVMNKWDRFDEIEVIALMELNAMIPRAKAAGVTEIPLDARLVKLLDLDVRIVLTWDADLTDMDLWVTEPSGEKAMYNNNRTEIGGLVSRDFTQGYGPEEYCLHRAVHGAYAIEVNYYGERAQTLQGPVTLQVDVYTDYGRPTEKRKSLTLRLKGAKDTFKVGEVTF